MKLNPLTKNAIVKYKDGHCRVKSLFKTHATLCGIFNGIIYHRNVPLTDIVEDQNNWYKIWQESETYKSM